MSHTQATGGGMPHDHVAMTPHLHEAGFEAKIAATFIGQAHFAGSGPARRTCRECRFWFIMRRPSPDADMRPSSPGYYGKKAQRPGELKRAKCNYAIAHKSSRRVPPEAMACRFFDPATNPPAPRKSS